MASQMEPRGCARACGLARGGGPRRSQDRLGSVLFSSCRSGSLFWSFWGRFGALRGSFWCFFGSSTHRFNPSTHQLVDSTHQLINLSTHHPMALRHFLTRPGGLRAARLNNFESFEISKFQFFGFISLNYPRLTVKTASPGPIVSVATPGSWECHDFL